MHAVATPSLRRFDRVSWLTVTFVASFAAVCALTSALSLSGPGDGCLLNLNAQVSNTVYACVGDWATPLRPGDQIVAVDGLSLADQPLVRQHEQRLTDVAAPTTLPYSVQRDGVVLELSVPVGRLDGAGVLRAFGAGLAHYSREWLLHIGIGAAIIFALAPRSRAAQLLLIATGSGGAVVTLAWTAESVGTQFFAPLPVYVGFVLITTFWGWLLLPTLVLLVLSFPRRVWPLTRWPQAAPIVLYALPLTALAASAVTGSFEIYLAALGLGAATFLLAAVTVTVHTFWRVRDPVVRAQTAWLSLGLALGLGVNPLAFAILLLFPSAGTPDGAVGADPGPLALLSDNLLTLAFLLCLGIAITRYRLFDIAVVINRALVYGLLTASLVAIYFGGVVLLQGLFRGLIGQDSDLAIVGSTLAIAALFQPLRHRIQTFIDHRFFRRKYDAAAVLAAYGAALRDDAELDSLRHTLIRVTDETMRPAQIGLWLRDADRASEHQPAPH